MWQKIAEYFLTPEATGYTIPKTLTYAVVLVLVVYAVYEILKKLKIKIDKKLAVGVAPFVVFGGAVRVLEDSGLLSSYWLVTPGVYALVFFIVFPLLLVSVWFERRKKIPYHKVLLAIGSGLALFTLSKINFVNPYGLSLVLIFFLPWVVFFFWFVKKWSAENKLVTLTQMFDATSTFVAVNYFSYAEQHVIPTALINLFGPFSFIVVKVVVVVGILVLIDKYSDDKNFSNWIKLCIAILGGATGTRDFVRLVSLT